MMCECQEQPKPSGEYPDEMYCGNCEELIETVYCKECEQIRTDFKLGKYPYNEFNGKTELVTCNTCHLEHHEFEDFDWKTFEIIKSGHCTSRGRGKFSS